jgi:hypothetical protein
VGYECILLKLIILATLGVGAKSSIGVTRVQLSQHTFAQITPINGGVAKKIPAAYCGACMCVESADAFISSDGFEAHTVRIKASILGVFFMEFFLNNSSRGIAFLLEKFSSRSSLGGTAFLLGQGSNSSRGGAGCGVSNRQYRTPVTS